MQFTPTYEEDFFLFRHEGDFQGRMQPGALLRFAQQIATDHCNSFGMDDAMYQRTHTAFLLAKLALEFRRQPHVDETLHFVTRPQAPQRAVYKRVTEVYDEQGAQVACVDSRWVLVDTQTRRIMRKAPEEMQVPWAQTVETELDLALPPRPETMAPAGEHMAAYSLCDMNGHLNNTRYADLACNALPVQVLGEKHLQRMVLHYHREVPPGEMFSISVGQVQDNVWFVSGGRENHVCFDAALWFEKEGK